jgi:hypothetical protein
MKQRSLPAWFTGNRVQGHTRLPVKQLNRDQFQDAAKGFKALGATVFSRHFKSRAEDPWREEVWRPMVDKAHEAGMKVIAYYWHMAETSLATAHPDWVCRKPDRTTPILKNPEDAEDDVGNFAYLDITGPYGEVVLSRLLKLAEIGVDGLMFDERHLPPEGCWGSALEDAWKAETGRPNAPSKDQEGYPAFLDFKARKIEDTFVHWRDAVHAQHPDVVLDVSTTTIPALTPREMTTRLVGVADSAKNEYRLALNKGLSSGAFTGTDAVDPPEDHVRQAVGWTVLRDSADGRPPRIWVSGVPNEDHAQGAAGSILAFGCIANMDVDEPTLVPPHEIAAEGKTPAPALRAAFKLGRDVSSHLAAAQPVRWAAVHFPEIARNAREDAKAAWKEVLWPMVGGFQALSEDGLPVGIVNDEQLAGDGLAGYRVLFLPDPDGLSVAQQQAVASFLSRGGVVVENNTAWAWSDPSARDAAFAAFRAAIQQRLTSAPVRVTGRPHGSYGVPYRSGNRLVVAVTNDFSWIQITNEETGSPDVVANKALDATGVRVTWRKGQGLPESWGPFPFPRLRAFEAVKQKWLPVHPVFPSGYRVDLPAFSFLAVLVVARRLRPLVPHEQVPDRQDVK